MANGNPFTIYPGNNVSQGLGGLGEAMMSAYQMRKERQAEEKAAERFATMKMGAMEVFRSGDPDAMAEFAIQNPEMSQALNTAMGFKSKRTENNYRDSLFSFYNDPTEENAESLIEDRIKVLDKDDVPEESRQETMSFMSRFREDPEAVKGQVEAEMAWRYPQRFQAMRTAMAKEEEKDTLTSNQKDYDRAKEEGFTGSFIEYQKALKQDPTQELDILKLRAQIADIEERRADRKQKQEEAGKLKDKNTKQLVTGIDNVVDEIGKAVMQVEESPTATGITGAVTGIVPGTPAYNLRRTVDTIKANLGFDKLQSMRDASPTGGALGQVSERELNFLQSTVTALDPNMGADELKNGLEKVKRHYNNWRKTLMGEIPEDDRPVEELTTEELMMLKQNMTQGQ